MSRTRAASVQSGSVKIGDVIEIPTPSGLVYAQVSHTHPEFGHLIRVLPGIHERPPDVRDLAKGPHVWSTFYPVDASLRRGFSRKVGSYPVPSHARRFPLFRAAGLPHPNTGLVTEWWLWDGRHETRIGALTDEQWDLPPREVLTHPTLVERVVTGWRPRDDRQRGSAPSSVRTPPPPSEPQPAQHFIYFRDEAAARAAAGDARGQGFAVELSEAAGEWVLVASSASFDIPSGRGRLEELAARHGGDYDGWEAAVAQSPRPRATRRPN